MASVEIEVSKTGSWSSIIHPFGDYNISISGTFQGNIWVQRSFQEGHDSWRNVEKFTTAIETSRREVERGVAYRIGGDVNQGAAICRLSYSEAGVTTHT